MGVQRKDGGILAWSVLFSSFLVNGVIFGLINSFGVLFVFFRSEIEMMSGENGTDSSIAASLIGSITVGITFAMSPVAGIVCDALGCRVSTIVGGLLSMVGMLASSFSVNHVTALYLTYGVLFGLGCSLCYTPSLAILGRHFDTRLGLANGIAASGSSLFTMGMPFVLEMYTKEFGIASTLRLMAGFVSLLVVAGLIYGKSGGDNNSSQRVSIEAKSDDMFRSHERPTTVSFMNPDFVEDDGYREVASDVQRTEFNEDNIHVRFSNAHYTIQPDAVMSIVSGNRSRRCKCFETENWSNRRYLIWLTTVPLALFGYFVPYVHIVQFAKEWTPNYSGSLLVTCLGLTSGIGRLIFGRLADHPLVNRISLQQLSFVVMGSCTIAIPVTSSFIEDEKVLYCILVSIALIMGLFDGCFITMFGPIAQDLCGSRGAPQAIGFILGICSIPLTAGPPIAGYIRDTTGSYSAAFISAGCSPILGAICMCALHRRSPKSEPNKQTTAADTAPAMHNNNNNNSVQE